jgi:hypothetical protein
MVSQERAAHIAGLSRAEFLGALGRFGVSPFQYGPEEIRAEFVEWLRRLQFYGAGYKDGKVFETWGICYVPNPCAPGRAK